ncbi:MAG: translocation/assembly module TamB domain-containing protein, partial [Azoarcus sp.]|nr:translocation/assembly module TamB domain-containing protein [Azoarcus sp.]
LEIHGADADEADGAAPVFVLREGHLTLDGTSARLSLNQLTADLPQGRIEATGEIDAAPPFALRLDGRLAAEAFALELDAGGSLAEPLLRLRAQGHGARGQATVVATPFAALPLKTFEIEADDVDPAAFAPGLPRAALRLRAAFTASNENNENNENGPPALRGPLRIDNARPTTLDAGGLPLASLRADVTAALDALRLDALMLEGGGGKLTGQLHWRRQAAAQDSKTATAAVPPAGFGQIDAHLDISALDPAQLDARLPARRVDGGLRAEADAQRQRGSAQLRAGAARIEAEGEIVAGIAPEPAFTLKLNLHDFDPAAFHPAAPPASIALQAVASGVLVEKAPLALHFAFGDDSRYAGQPLGGSGRFALEGTSLRDVALGLDLAGNRLRLAGNWGRPEDRLTLDIDAPRLAAAGHGLAGRLRATGAVTGGLLKPAGTLRLDAEKLRLPGDLAIAALVAEARIEPRDEGPFALKLDGTGLTAGELRLASARIEADGRRDRHRIRIDAEGRFRDNTARLATTLEGGLQGIRWLGRLLTLENSGSWPLRLRAPATLEIGPEELRLAGAAFDAGKQGNIRLTEIRWKNGEALLRGALNGLALTTLPGLGQRQRDPLTLGGHWDLRIGKTIEGEARLLRESGDLSVQGEISTRLGLERLEAHLSAHDRRLTLAFAAQGREAGELGISLEAAIERGAEGWRLTPRAPLAGAAHLAMPSLAWLGRLSRENVETAGLLSADITLAGTPAAPELRGNITGNALRLALIDQGLILAGGDLEAGFAHRDGRHSLHLRQLAFESANRVKPRDKRIPIDDLTATPGRLRITGDIALDTTQRGHFEFTAERLPLLQRPDRWLIVSGQGSATLQGKALDLDARLRADAGYIEIDATPPPGLGDDVAVHRAGKDDAARETTENLAIAGKIALDLGRSLYLDAFGVDTRLAGGLELQLRPGAPMRALGTLQTVDGNYRGYGQRLAIERGTITFRGEPDNPGLNIVAMRRGMEVDAGVAITGDAHRPQVKLVSEPTVPDPEKLSWLVLGRPPDAAGADLGLLIPAAQALFGGPGGGMTEELARGLGFDSFTIGQGELNSSRRSATSKVVGGGSRISAGPAASGDVVAVGKRLTNDLSLSFEQSLAGAESLVKLTYRLGRRLSLVARGGTDNALDVYYTFFIGGGGEKKEKARADESPTPRPPPAL